MQSQDLAQGPGPESIPERELTFGEKAVGITFNPGGMPQVNKIKSLAAALVDEINDQRAGDPGAERHPEKWDQFTEAIRRIQEGQMWAVKAATWQY